MKKIFTPIFICLCLIAYVVGYTTTTSTTNLKLVKIAEGDLIFDWFDTMNDNLDLIDDIFDDVTLTEFSYLDGVTSSIQAQLDSKATGDFSLYYLKTQIDTLGEVETIYSANITDSTELATALADYYLKTAIDTLPEMETIWALNVTTSTELATALGDYYLKTAIDTQGEVETIWGVSLANDSELHSQNTDTDLDATFEATFFKKADSIGDIGDVDLTDIANLKILKYNSTSGNWECETESGGGASELADLTDVGVTTPTDKYVLVADGDSFESRAISSADLSDVASIAMLDENEIVTGNWIFGAGLQFQRAHDTATVAPQFLFYRARDGDPTDNVSDGDYLGYFDFEGYHTDGYDRAATIRVTVDGTPGNFRMPGRLEFLTSPDAVPANPILRMAIDSAGNIKMGDGAWTNYVNVSNAGVLTFEGTANVPNVVFPAEAAPSANAKTLDDYEEGEWTASLKFGGNSVDMTYQRQAGLYTKIGRQVTVTCHLLLTAKGSSIGDATITGLPFACTNDDGATSAISLLIDNITFANFLQGNISQNTAIINLFEITEAGVQTNLDESNFANNSRIIISVTYFTD